MNSKNALFMIGLATASAVAAAQVTGSGGTVTYDGDYVVHTFTNDDTFVFSGGEVDVLLVGGGGGGGSGRAGGGGGGAGGFVYRQHVVLQTNSYPIVVGKGGKGCLSYAEAATTSPAAAEDGGITTAFGLTAHGGGHGGNSLLGSGSVGGSGASGGGGASKYVTNEISAMGGGAADYGDEGCPGGSSTNSLATGSYGHTHSWQGGGGGAGGVGGNGVCTAETGAGANTTGIAGAGGAGLPCSISGAEVYYAGGGGGGYADYSNPSSAGTVPGGSGGGGAGSGGRTSNDPWPGQNGTDGLGGGGGGGGAFGGKYFAAGGNGGCGVVIVRYRRVMGTFESINAVGARRFRKGGYAVFAFTNNGTFSVTGSSIVDVLLVGGGGGGGSGRTGGGGGGSGGFLYKTGYFLTNGTYQVTVGAGGAGGSDYEHDAENGGDTRVFDFMVHGGGAGGRGINTAGGPGSGGGSGGGGASQYQSGKITSLPGGAPFDGEGFGGGCSTNEMFNGARGHLHCYAGGGGGAGAKGGDAWITKTGDTEEGIVGAAGRGGNGLPCSITGTEVYYAGGGGGGYADKTNPTGEGTVDGGLGGGGKGSGGRTSAAPWNGVAGTDGLGGGGGGAGAYENRYGGIGGKGGAGTVIIRCAVNPTGMILVFR